LTHGRELDAESGFSTLLLLMSSSPELDFLLSFAEMILAIKNHKAMIASKKMSGIIPLIKLISLWKRLNLSGPS
jgi:hypothetical protein